MARKKNKRSIKKYQAGEEIAGDVPNPFVNDTNEFDFTPSGGPGIGATMIPFFDRGIDPGENAPVLDDYGNPMGTNWGGNPETKEEFDQRIHDMFVDNTAPPPYKQPLKTISPINRSISKMNSLNWEGIKRNGGEILKSFKSAARFDQPKFKNGRRTKG